MIALLIQLMITLSSQEPPVEYSKTDHTRPQYSSNIRAAHVHQTPILLLSIIICDIHSVSLVKYVRISFLSPLAHPGRNMIVSLTARKQTRKCTMYDVAGVAVPSGEHTPLPLARGQSPGKEHSCLCAPETTLSVSVIHVVLQH